MLRCTRRLGDLGQPLFVITACALGLTAASCKTNPRMLRVIPEDARLLYLGAFDRQEPQQPRFAWPATEVRFRFRGSAVSVELTDTPYEDETRETNFISVQVDDAPPSTIALREGKVRYPLAHNLAPGSHTLRLIKRTEAEVGTITLHDFTLSAGAEIETIARPQRRILFVGDSITAGYGNEGPNERCPYSPSSSDATRTFASLAARELGAEGLLHAWSGKGVSRNYEARDEGTMPELFMRVLPGDVGSPEIAASQPPDAVVIALGTNDFFRGTPDEQTFLLAYRSMLNRLARYAPRAPTLFVLSPMLADDHPQPQARSTLRRWLERLAAERARSQAKAEVLEQWVDPAEGLGCDYHPNVRTQTRLARELSTALRALAGW